MKKLSFSLFLCLSLLSCSRTGTPGATSTPAASPAVTASATASASASPAVTASATPEGVPLGDPMLPADVDTFMTALPSWTLTDSETHPWWTNSGVSDNALRAYTSDLEPEQAEERLMTYLQEDTKVPLPGTEGFFDVEDSRLALYAKEGDSFSVAVLVCPPAQPPRAWEKLGVPPIDWAANAATLEGKKSVVVFFSGFGAAEHLRDKLAASASTEAEATVTPEAAASPDL
jgi:hypothetical protein